MAYLSFLWFAAQKLMFATLSFLKMLSASLIYNVTLNIKMSLKIYVEVIAWEKNECNMFSDRQDIFVLFHVSPQEGFKRLSTTMLRTMV